MQTLLASHPHIPGLVIQAARLSLLLVILTAFFAPLEHFFSVRPARLFRKGWATDLGWYFLNGLMINFLIGVPAALIAVVVHATLPASFTGAAATFPLWARMSAAILVGEIGFYWGHRWSHEWPFLWRFHSIHHSAEHINFLVNTRGHPVDVVFTRVCGLVLLYAFGLASAVGPNPTFIPALVLFTGATWSYFIHANVRWRLGPLEQLIASPAFHHWHHTLNDHRDRNYSSLLPFIDRLFGTFYLPKREWPAAYGIDAPMPQGLGDQLIEPLVPSRMRYGTAQPPVR